jgi:CheY-like chemotaxis protein
MLASAARESHPTGPVLVVEDNPDVRDSTAMLLEVAGYATVTAEHGKDALDRLHSGKRPCLILLDLMMPVMDGFEFRAAQLAEHDLASIPVIVVSAFSSAPDAKHLGVRACMAKPIDVEQLLENVGAYCERSS